MLKFQKYFLAGPLVFAMAVGYFLPMRAWAVALIDLNVGSGVNVETGTTSSSVNTNADLEAYARRAINSDEALEELNFTGDTVEVRYKQRGRLLALIPITFTVKAVAHADGEVELNYPWYSFLTIDNKNELETEVRVAVSNSLAARMVGSVQAEGEVENPKFTASESATIASEIHAVLKAKFEAYGSVDNSLE